MAEDELIGQVVNTWAVNNDALLLLVKAIPKAGFDVRPALSKGRTVGEMLLHMNRARLAWLSWSTGTTLPKLPRIKGAKINRSGLVKELASSSALIREYLEEALRGGKPPRNFRRNPVRFAVYLIMHESHHRGQIMLALKQNNVRIPVNAAGAALWGRWIWGKEPGPPKRRPVRRAVPPQGTKRNPGRAGSA